MTTPNDPTISRDSLDAVIAGYMLAVEAGDVPNRQELLGRHPEHADSLLAFFADLDRMDRVASPCASPTDWMLLAHPRRMATPLFRRSATSATTSSWKRSPGAGWASSIRPGRLRSIAWSRSR